MHINNKKNIIFFLPNFEYGGAAKSIINLVSKLNKKKYNLLVFCLVKCDYEKELKKYNVKLYKINVKKVIFAIFFIRKIVKKIIKKTKLETIFVSNINYTNVISLIFLSSVKNLKIITIDRTPVQELDINYFNPIIFFKNFIIKSLIKLTYIKANCRIGNSLTLSKDLSKISNSKFITIYPLTLKKIIPWKKKIIKNKVEILWIGRLSKEKDFLTIIQSAKLLINENIVFNVVGDGNDICKIKNEIHRLKIKKLFKFHGYAHNIEKFLWKCDLYISTSLYEGFQNSMIEAINYNLPVISSRSFGGVNDILKNGKYGFLYNVKDYINLARLIKKYISNKKIFYQKAKLAKHNLKSFSFSKSIHKYEEVLDSI
jgi:glycosyltransferase involved in cell wall biosynthesis